VNLDSLTMLFVVQSKAV